MSKESLLFEIADRQQGYFTAGQACESGYYTSHFQRPLDSGEWKKARHGIYCLARYPLADEPDLVELSLWSRNKKGEVQGVWSHETALDRYELCDIMPRKLHMTVPKHFRRSAAIPAVLRLRYCDLSPSDWQEQHGYRITTPIRTLLDVIREHHVSDEFIEQAVIEGRRKGILLPQDIENLTLTPAEIRLKELYER